MTTLRNALVDELRGIRKPTPPGGNTGISGMGLPGGVQAPTLQSEAPAPAGPDFNTVGKFAGARYDPKKLNDPNHQTARYRIGRVLSHFDPAAGITPDVVNALNTLGLGTFSGQGDKLTLANAGAEFDGVGGTDDIIHRFTGPGAAPAWAAYTNEIGQAQQKAKRAQMGGGGGMGGNAGLMSAMGGLDALLQRDPITDIQSALGRVQRPNFEALLAALSGGA